MSHLNVEIKAKCNDPAFVRNYLLSAGAEFKGIDTQTDTYFNVSAGRLKLRQGNIENHLIYYERPDKAGPKNSHFELLKIPDAEKFRQVMSKSCGVKVVIKKRREIYYIKNVKFHIDEVNQLGTFIEIEAGNLLADLSVEELTAQCKFYLKEFGIQENDLLKESYSDMLLKNLN
ncbi:MAG TPA: class IV adenylate cyclase [Chitinophagaceae bacterium]|nr:class IV adenylate cyclase [Chitinophagaceae bacterium]